MYWFISVAITPVDHPDKPLSQEEWRARACMHVSRTDNGGFVFIHEWMRDHGFQTVDLEDFDAPVLPADYPPFSTSS